MSATTLPALAEHIAENELPWRGIVDCGSNLSVQLTGGSWHDLARWAASLDGVVWRVGDFRECGSAGPVWHVAATGDLDGDVEVWCSVPADFADTELAVIDRMREQVALWAVTVDD